MTAFFCCRFCVVELERVKLADGTVALVCVDCDVISLEHEIAPGGPMGRPAGSRSRAPRRSRGFDRPRMRRERSRTEPAVDGSAHDQ